MREIEFRGKSKRTGKWVYGNLIIKKIPTNLSSLEKTIYNYKYSISYLNKNGKYSICEVDEKTIGQYINRKDCDDKGERLYEGDILWDEYNEEYCYIDFDEVVSKYSLEYKESSEDIESLVGIEKVGNIYDNPELLEE